MSPLRLRSRFPLGSRKFSTTRVGPGGQLASFGIIVLATLTRTVCPEVIPTMPNEMRSLTGGGSWSCAFVRGTLRKIPKPANIVNATKAAAIVNVRLFFIFLFSLICKFLPNEFLARPAADKVDDRRAPQYDLR